MEEFVVSHPALSYALVSIITAFMLGVVMRVVFLVEDWDELSPLMYLFLTIASALWPLTVPALVLTAVVVVGMKVAAGIAALIDFFRDPPLDLP